MWRAHSFVWWYRRLQVRDRLGRSGREDWGGGQFVESAESEFHEGFVWDMGGVEV